MSCVVSFTWKGNETFAAYVSLLEQKLARARDLSLHEAAIVIIVI